MGLSRYLAAYKSNATTLGMSEESFFMQELWKYAGGQASTVIDAVRSAANTAGDTAIVTQIDQTKAGATAVVSGGGGAAYVVHGSLASPIAIVAAGGMTSTSDLRSLFFTKSSGGIYAITAIPQISAGSIVGQEMRITGTSNVNAVIFDDGNGLLLNGPVTLESGVSIDLWWNGAVWQESDRSN